VVANQPNWQPLHQVRGHSARALSPFLGLPPASGPAAPSNPVSPSPIRPTVMSAGMTAHRAGQGRHRGSPYRRDHAGPTLSRIVCHTQNMIWPLPGKTGLAQLTRPACDGVSQCRRPRA
jgi:hypothetical protein